MISDFLSKNIMSTLLFAVVFFAINISYSLYLKPDISTAEFMEFTNTIKTGMNKLDGNLTIDQREKVILDIEKSLKKFKIDNVIFFIKDILFPILTSLFVIFFLYISYQLYQYIENIKVIKDMVCKTQESVENAHVLNPDKDNNLSARAQVLNIFNRELYTDNEENNEEKVYEKTVDILFSNDYYSYLLTKSYLDYFFYRIQQSDLPIRYIVVDKYSHGLLVYSALCKHAGYVVKFIKKKKYLEILTGCATHEYFMGNPFFVFAKDSKILRTTYMTFSNDAISITDEEKNRKNYEIIEELDKIAFRVSPTTEINSTFLKGFIGECR